MSLRKGQHLFNEIAKKHELISTSITITVHSAKEYPESKTQEFPYYNLHKILFYMTDKEFDSIMTKLSNVMRNQNEP